MAPVIVLEHTRMPRLRRSLPRLFTQRKPALVRAGRRVPRIEARLSGHRPDAARLRAYRKVCGFAARSDHLPVTLPHVLATPLHLEMLTHPAFPIGLLGLVHVRNTIILHRRLHSDEAFDLSAVLDGHREVRSGQEFDLLTSLAVGGAVVWEEVCTFLARGASRTRTGGRRERTKPPAALAGGEMDRFLAPGHIGRDYARVSGDYNPIHLSALTAKPFGFPRAIAHGMWTLGRVAAELDARWPDGPTRFSAEFKQPILLPGAVTLARRYASDRIAFELRDEAGERLHLTGSVERAD